MSILTPAGVIQSVIARPVWLNLRRRSPRPRLAARVRPQSRSSAWLLCVASLRGSSAWLLCVAPLRGVTAPPARCSAPAR
ncbi:hypothetical protein EYF80_065541 [Liparis tanakae]|uniref:Uncharacterized protein n=1 Tax=Liparis tanakae TaxID=230148 RepID=A0A4Z2E6D5_9TELE|nr:hypothetical protein EYF80_065541 [Liparis tanakae]